MTGLAPLLLHLSFPQQVAVLHKRAAKKERSSGLLALKEVKGCRSSTVMGSSTPI